MWRDYSRARRAAIIALLALGVFLSVVVIAHAFPAPQPAFPGPSCDPQSPGCSSISFSCIESFSGFVACVQSIILGSPAAIWNAISGEVYSAIANAVSAAITTVENWVNDLIVSIANGVGAALASAVQSIIGVFESAFQAVLNLISGAVAGLTQWVDSLASAAGPFAPAVVMLLTAALVLGGLVLFYFFGIAMIAVAKTIFNLL